MTDETQEAAPTYEQVVLQKIKLAAVRAMPDGMHDVLANATFKTKHQWMADCLVGEMRAYVWGMNEQRIRAAWPADWWEAVKQRFAPKWFLRRWPVRFDSIDEPQFEAVYLSLYGDRITVDPAHGRHGNRITMHSIKGPT